MAIEDSPDALEIFVPPVTDDEIEAAVTGLIHDTHDATGRTYKDAFPKAMKFLERQEADFWRIVDVAKVTLEAAGLEVSEGSIAEAGMNIGVLSVIEVFARVAEARHILGPPA